MLPLLIDDLRIQLHEERRGLAQLLTGRQLALLPTPYRRAAVIDQRQVIARRFADLFDAQFAEELAVVAQHLV